MSGAWGEAALSFLRIEHYETRSLVDSCTQDPIQRETFELICVYAGRNMSKIPIDFLIGFYVQQVK